jgi:hypothetical protein
MLSFLLAARKSAGALAWACAAACYALALLSNALALSMPVLIAAWLLRRDMPDAERPYRAPRGTIMLGVFAACVWLVSAILGFQQQDAGPKYYRWPAGGTLANMNDGNRAEAIGFLDGLARRFEGSSSLLDAFEQAFQSPAEAIVLVSDGLPNPAFNENLSPSRLVRRITLSNTQGREIHAVTVGDYFKYRGTVEFMESLARANSGGFLALAE